MKYNSIYNNFGSGELSRNLFGRTDLEEYFKGVAELTNFVPTRQGGASFRPGTVCVEAGYPVTASSIVSFSPRDDERYAVILQPGRPIQILNSNGVSGTITQPSYPWNTRTDFTSSTEAYNAPADDSDHQLIVESLQSASSGDVLIIVDGTGVLAPIVIFRTDVNTFIVDSLIQPQVSSALSVPFLFPPLLPMRVPYTDPNIDTNIRLVVSATTGTITISSQNASGTAIPFFTGDVVGMGIKISNGTTTGVAFVSAKISDSSVTAIVNVAFGGTTAQTDFETSQWNPRDGYPRSVCFHEGRLIFGANNKYPDTIWCSHTGNIYHFMQRRLLQDASTNVSGLNYFGAVKATDPFSFIPAAVGANSIQWLYPADSLLVGTTGNEFSITGGTESFLSLASILVKSISSHGSSKVQPIKVGSSVLFISSDGKRVLEIPKRLVEYSSATDWTGLAAGIVEKSIESVSTDLTTIFALNSRITKFTWDESSGVLWCVCKNKDSDISTLITLTVNITTKVVAWAKHKISGLPYISSIEAVQDVESKGSVRLFMFLKRDGSSSYSLEAISYRSMHDYFLPSRLNSKPLTVYLDGSAFGFTDGTPDELYIASDQRSRFAPGHTYSVIKVENGIGTYLGDYTDTNLTASGNGVLPIPGLEQGSASVSYIVGSSYEGLIKTMPIEAGAQFGVAQGSARRSHEISLYVDRSLGGKYKASKANNEFPIVGTKGSPSSLYTGEIKLSLNASPDDHQTVIKQTEPYPLTILWLLTKGYTYDV